MVGWTIQFSARLAIGPSGQQNLSLPKHDKQYTGMRSLAPWQTQQDCINASVIDAPHHNQGSWECPPWF